jgi:deoxycytidylate deaminase
MKHAKYFDLLFKIADAVEPVARQRLAACLVYKNDIVSIGTNKKKTHPFQRKYSSNDEAIWLHAETDCIVNALRHVDADTLSKCTMYVLRVKRPDDDPKKFVQGLSKPCEGCQRALAQFGIKKVCYTLDDDGFEFL